MGESDILSQSEIDNLLNSLSSSAEVEEKDDDTSKNAILQGAALMEEMTSSSDKKGYKLYNFRRPDKFSKDHLRALQDIHKEFSRQLELVLTAYLRLPVNIDVISVDQLTYDEFTRAMPSPITIGILELNPLPGQILLGISHEINSSIVDRMLGGTGLSESKARELTDIEEALTKRVVVRMCQTLEEAWKTVFPVQGNIVGMDNNYTMIQIANPSEIVALITIEITISNKFSGLLSFCFPYPVLESVIGQLSSQHIFQSKNIVSTVEDKETILSRLNNTTLGVNVVLGETDINIKDLVDLKVGDVLKLNSSVKDDLFVYVNKELKFLGRPGLKNNKVAVNITEILNNIDELIKVNNRSKYE